MAGEIVPAVKVIAPDVYEIRGERVMLDAHVAQAFGTETKRVNEAVARNADKFTEAHTFQLSPAEHDALRSQTATSNTGRGGVRYQPHVFTMKGVARLATVLNTSEALRATDLIIDTFLVVYDQVSEGRSRIAIPEPDQYRSSPESRRAIQKFKTKLANALTALLDTIVDVQSKRTARELGQSLGADAVQNIQDRLRSRGLQNTKLEADTTLVLAQAEQTLAATRKTHAEADSIDIQNLERRIDVVKKLIDMSKHLEPAEFVELMDTFETEPDRKLIGAPGDARKGAKKPA
jgi:ORF6N domain-containing protein